jgi:hypothetical protein
MARQHHALCHRVGSLNEPRTVEAVLGGATEEVGPSELRVQPIVETTWRGARGPQAGTLYLVAQHVFGPAERGVRRPYQTPTHVLGEQFHGPVFLQELACEVLLAGAAACGVERRETAR